MNKFIDWIISSLKSIGTKNKLYLIAFYNKTRFLINRNFTLNEMYAPIIEEKTNTNKKLREDLKVIGDKNKETEKNILKIKNENTLLQTKISIIQNLLTKRHY